MICPRCGAENNFQVAYCRNCGSNFKELIGTWPAYARAPLPGEKIYPWRAVPRCFMKYVDFQGRASRAEFWWFFVFLSCIFIIFGAIRSFLDSRYFLTCEPNQIGITTLLILFVGLIVGFPFLAALVRRLHDTNHNGWSVLIPFTLIGMIPFIYWIIKTGDPDPNRFGHPC